MEVLAAYPGYRTRLLRIARGVGLPHHTHEGFEYTIVLEGGFSDQWGEYLEGDFAIADQEVDHAPVADARDGCLCLAVTDAPLRLTGPLGRFLNLFLRL